jgi:cytochrome c553
VKAGLRRRVLRWLAALALVGFVGFLLAASGIIPIRASGGHWGIIEWIFQFGKRRSLATHTLGVELPQLDDPALVMKGAAHYESGCMPCHGSPDHERPRIAAAMLPPPPYLPPRIPELKPEAMFYVVKHGIKLTGMPAWPSQYRDDEVHAMVAFLLVLPSLDAAGYRRLALGDAVPSLGSMQELSSDVAGPVPDVIASCDRCHGRDTPAFPRLAGQKREYLLRALAAYKDGARHSGIMEPVAAPLRDDERSALADHYAHRAGLGSSHVGTGRDDLRVARGQSIVHDGIPSQGVPPCQDCHGPGPNPRNAAYPHLAGQFAEYLVLQLELFERDQRGGSDYAHIMRRIASRLTAEQMRDAAAYYAAFVESSQSQRPQARR